MRGGQRVFNYRLSRAWRIIENCFGIASAVLRKPIELEPEKVSTIVPAIWVLHNFLWPVLKNDIENIENGTIQPGEWRQKNEVLLPIQVNRNLRGNVFTKEVQEKLTQYFQEEGDVSW